VRFEVLGPVTVVSDDGVDVTPRGAQQRRLLAALVANAPDAVGFDALHDLLWPGEPHRANALQAQVSKLRKALPGIEIVADRAGYALVPNPADTVDLTEFERLTTSGRRAAADRRWTEAAGTLNEALDLVRGQPLGEVADADCGRAAAARLAALVTNARSSWVEAELACGRVAETEAALEALVAAEPLNEHWWAQLMVARYRQGRAADALRAFQDARRILADELGLEPGPELRAVEAQVLGHDAGLGGDGAGRDGDDNDTPRPEKPPSRRRRPPLPARLTSLIGRDELLAGLAADAERSRLVTLVGPGGAGKTSLAHTLARRRPDGEAAIVTLAAVEDGDSVPTAIADALGIAADTDAPGGGQRSPLEHVIDGLDGDRLLLVMDNCEHVVEAAAKSVHRLLEECPGVTVIATSRQALGVPGETVREVPMLSAADAERLFLERAGDAVPGFRPDDADRAAIHEICSRLDGLPLAIELAAARVRSLQPTELLARLDDRFAVLDRGPRTVEPRQQTLRAVVEWSHDLLDDQERAVFRRLSVFRGGATLASAEAVCGDGELVPVHEVEAIVGRLVERSLVAVDRRRTHVRYWLLWTLGAYAKERLATSGEIERVSVRHAEHFAAFIAPAEQALLGPDQGTWLEGIATERENLRVALDTALARGDGDLALRLTAPIGWYYYMVAQHHEGEMALADALSCPGPTDPADRAMALAHFAWLAANGPDLAVALDATSEALDLLAAVDDPWVEWWVVTTRILISFFRGRVDEAQALYAQAQDAAARSDRRWPLAITELIGAELYGFAGDAEAARAATDEAIAIFEEVGDDFSLALTLTQASDRAVARGDYDGALALLARSIELSERVGFSGKPQAVRAHVATVEVLRGNLAVGERLHREVLAEFTDGTLPWVQSLSCHGLALACRMTDRPQEALQWLDRAWDLSHARDAPMMRSNVLIARGYCADQLGDHEAALRHQLEGLDAAVLVPGPRAMANSFEGLAGALAAAPDRSRHELAARLLGYADALRRSSGGPLPAGERFDVDRAEARLLDSLGRDEFEAAAAKGAASLPDALIADLRALP
jgi:predicted ATPase/DNA-binding SARP family transcriptional activator